MEVQVASVSIIQCVIGVIKVKLHIQWSLAGSRKKCSCCVINLVPHFPGPRATAVDGGVVLASTEGGESKAAIVLANMMSKVSHL